MGAGASTHSMQGELVEMLPTFEEEALKPADASDLPNDPEVLRKAIIKLRSKVRAAVASGKAIVDGEEKILQDHLNQLLENAMIVETTITPFLQQVVAKCGGELVGLKHRFKTRESLERKIKGDVEAKKRSLARENRGSGEVDVVSIVKNIGDALRYTMLVPEEHYCRVVLETRKTLAEIGNPGSKFKNYWEKGDMYQGINDLYRNETTNFTFELQYHTAASWTLKAESHIIYEKFRVCKDPSEQQKLFEEGVTLANSLAIPEGVEDIPTLVKNPEPNVVAAYAYIIHQNGKKKQETLLRWFKEHVGEKGVVHIEVDDSATIEAELMALMDAKQNALTVEELVREHYFFGISVKVIVSHVSGYDSVAKQLLRSLVSTNHHNDTPDKKDDIKDASHLPVIAAHVQNRWRILQQLDQATSPTRISQYHQHLHSIPPGIRIYAIAGSRATKLPDDNLLFEVLITTQQAQEVAQRANLLRAMATSTSTEQLPGLWHSVEIPSEFDQELGTYFDLRPPDLVANQE